MDTPGPSVSSTPPDKHTAAPETPDGTLLASASESTSDLSAYTPGHHTNLEETIPVTPQHGLPLDEPTAVRPLGDTPAGPPNYFDPAYIRPHRGLRFAALGIALAAGVVLSILASHQPATQDPISSIDRIYGHVAVPFNELPSPQLDAASTLPDIVTVNGELNIQGSVVLAPTAQPAAPIPGQLYFDQTSSELSYFDGKSFSTVLTTDTLPPQQSGLAAGGGLSLRNGLLTNAGVLSLQGVSGAISLSAGPGVQIAGTTFSNTGVLSIGGLSGDVVLGNGLALSGDKLSSSGVQSLSTDGSLNISNDGQGNFTITGPMGVGSGNVSTVGGTTGRLAVFNGAQAITDSLLSETGSTVSVAGSLVVSSTISASGYSGDGANITGLSAGNLSSGTLNDARLSINVPLLNSSNNFTGSLQHNGNNLCDTSGNCVGVSGGGLGGSGTANKLALFTGGGLTLGNSLLSQDAGATTVTVTGSLTVTGGISATSFSGNGSGVTNVNAAQLGGQAGSYYLNATNISTGSLNDSRLSTNVALKNSAANFTNTLQHNGNNVCDASGNCVGVSGGGLGGSGTANLIALFTGSGFTVGNSILSQDVGATTVTVAGNLVATSFSGGGSGLTGLNASNLSSGTVNDARLSTNAALKNAAANFTASLQHNGNNVCDASGNCVGSGAGGAIGGNGTANQVAMFNGGGFTIANSLLSQDAGATTVTATGNFVTTGGISAGSSITTTGTVQGSTLNATSGYQVGGVAGATTTCSGGQFLQNQVVSGGIVTGGSCAAAGGGVNAIGALDGGTANATGATISANTLYLQSASASFAGLVNTGTQSFAGAKTFGGGATVTGALTQSGGNFSLTSTGTSSLTAGGSLQLTAAGSSKFVTSSGDLTLGTSASTGQVVIQATGASGAVSIGDSSTATISIGSVANIARTINIGSSNTSVAQTINLGSTGTVNVGSTGTATGSSTTNVGTTSNATGTQTINLGSTANAGNAVTLSAGNTGKINLNGNAVLTGTLSGSSTINAVTGYQTNGVSGSNVTCSGGQFLQNQVVSGGIVTGGSCTSSGGSGTTTIGALDGGTANANGATISGTTLYLQSASASFAGLVNTSAQTFAGAKTFNSDVTVQGNLYVSTVLLTDATDLTFTAPDTTTDSNVVFNMQCRTGCSSTQGRFAIQSNGVDAFWIGYNTVTSATEINVPGGIDIKMGSGTTNGVESALTHDFTCTAAEQIHYIVKISGTAVAVDTGGGTTGSIAVAGVVVAKPSTTICTVAFSGVVQVYGASNTINVNLPVITSNIAGAATTTNTPSNGATLGHAFSGKNGSNLFWVLLNGG